MGRSLNGRFGRMLWQLRFHFSLRVFNNSVKKNVEKSPGARAKAE
jgi:hypothetical protein